MSKVESSIKAKVKGDILVKRNGKLMRINKLNPRRKRSQGRRK